MVVIKASNLDLSKVTFSDVKTDTHGRKMVYVNGNGGKIMVQTPKMYAPNGVKRWRKKDAIDNKDDKFELELSFYGEAGTDKNSKEIKDLHEKWEQFDTLIKEKVIEKAREWLSMSKLDMTTLESVMYTPMVRVAKDKEGNDLPYPSRIRAKIDRDLDANGNPSGKFLSNKKFKSEVLIFDESKQTIDFNEDNAETVVPKGSQVVCILELVYLSLSKTTISTKWKLVQAKVHKNQDSISGYALLDDDAEEDTEANNEAEANTEGVLQEDLDTNNDDEVEQEVEQEDDNGDEVEASEAEEEVVVKPVVTTKAAPKSRAKRGLQA